jgi:carbamoyl-phosphate synthase large subunit
MPATNVSAALALAGRAPALLRAGRRAPRAFSAARSLSTTTTTRTARIGSVFAKSQQSKRLGTVTVVRPYSTGQTAPDPKAYLESGIVKPQQTVDVKKVLVIGSGGIAIGQAGEFDYSGS